MISSPLIGQALITQISADPSELDVFPPHSERGSTGRTVRSVEALSSGFNEKKIATLI